MDIKPTLNFRSLRAQTARFATRFGKVWHTFMALVAATLFLVGIWLLIEHGAIGWLLIGLSGPIVMLTIWWQGDLKTMSISAKPQTIDDILGNLVQIDVGKRFSQLLDLLVH